MDLLCFFCLVFAIPLCTSVVCLWSPAGKGLTSWLRLWCPSVSLSLSHWYPGSGVILDCIDSYSLHPCLLLLFYSPQKSIFFIYLKCTFSQSCELN